MTPAARLALVARLARAELRGGLSGMWVLLACLTLGVAAVAGVESLSAAFKATLSRDAAEILGGDLEISLTHRPAEPGQEAFFQRQARVSHIVSLRAMATTRKDGATRRALASLKAVDRAYPLYGRVALDPDIPLETALAVSGGLPGAVAAPELLDRLGLALGDELSVAEGTFRLTAVLRREPDRVEGLFGFGPRLLIGLGSLDGTGLLQPGSLIRHEYRLRPPPGRRPEAVAEAMSAAFPSAGWRVRLATGAAPGLSRFFDRMTAIMSLVGLAALLLGGLGVAQATRGLVDKKAVPIAVFKSLGAPGGLIFTVFLAQILVLAACGVVVGLAVGAAVPYLLGPLFSGLLPIAPTPGLYPEALAPAAAFGFLTALAFSAPQLSVARRLPALVLFRGYAAPDRPRPGPAALAATALFALALVGLALAVTPDRRLGLGFIAAGLGAAVTLALVSRALTAILSRLPAPRSPRLALALSALTRPGNQVRAVLASLGLGLTVLSGMALIDANFAERLAVEIPAQAPDYFFVDIQPHQLEAFTATVRSVPGIARLEVSPTLRGRVTAIRGRPPEEVLVDPDAAWAARGDRGLTTAAAPPPDTILADGTWWPEDYAGPPLASMDADIAKGFGVRVGDMVRLNVLGREMDVTVASLRRINWLSLGINYVFVLSPGSLDDQPLTYLATAYADKAGPDPTGAGKALFEAVSGEFPNITAVGIGETLADVTALAGRIGVVVRAAALTTLAAGLLVLIQTLRTHLARKAYESVIYKVCGATRADILAVLGLEYALLGLLAGLVALLLGSGLSALFVDRYLLFPWRFYAAPALLTLFGATALTILPGLFGAWRLLGQKAWPHLRNE